MVRHCLAIASVTILLGSASSASAADDCRGQVAEAFKKQREVGSFRMVSRLPGREGMLTQLIEYVIPDGIYEKMSIEGQSDTRETIAIDQKVWRKLEAGWQELPAATAHDVGQSLGQLIRDPGDKLPDFACLGPQGYDGRQVLAYKSLPPKPEGAEPADPQAQIVQTVFVDPESGLPARNLIVAPSMEKPLVDAAYSYPTGLTLAPPAVSGPVAPR